MLWECIMMPQLYLLNICSYSHGLREPGLDGQVWPLPHALQPNMHFNSALGSNSMSSILKNTAWSAPISMAFLMYFSAFSAAFFISALSLFISTLPFSVSILSFSIVLMPLSIQLRQRGLSALSVTDHSRCYYCVWLCLPRMFLCFRNFCVLHYSFALVRSDDSERSCILYKPIIYKEHTDSNSCADYRRIPIRPFSTPPRHDNTLNAASEPAAIALCMVPPR